MNINLFNSVDRLSRRFDRIGRLADAALDRVLPKSTAEAAACYQYLYNFWCRTDFEGEYNSGCPGGVGYKLHIQHYDHYVTGDKWRYETFSHVCDWRLYAGCNVTPCT